MDDISHKLNQFFKNHLPITDYLGMHVEEYNGDSLTLYAPLQPSLNDKLTAFGGSLFCLSVMSCWGMVYLKAIEAGCDDANIVVTQSNIAYRAPIDTAMRATCKVPSTEIFTEFFERYHAKGKAKISLSAEMYNEGSDIRAVTFEGQYAILK